MSVFTLQILLLAVADKRPDRTRSLRQFIQIHAARFLALSVRAVVVNDSWIGSERLDWED
jgi:hypothetical protein